MNRSAKLRRIALLLFITPGIFLFLLYMLFRYDNKYTVRSPQPVCGFLYLSEGDLEQYPFFVLTRQWQYYPDVLLSPDDFAQEHELPYMRYLTIGQYNDFSLGDSSRSTHGCATYRLLISLPEREQIYSLALPEIYSSYRLYVNGEILQEMGSPDQVHSDPVMGQRTVSFAASGSVELLLCVSDYSHYYSGLTYPPLFGLAQNVRRAQDLRMLLSLSIILVTLIVGAGFFYVGLADRQKQILLYALLCLCFIGFSSYSLYFAFFSTASRLPYALELLCTYGFYLTLVLLQSLFPGLHRFFYRFTVTVLGIFCAAAFLYGLFPAASPLCRELFSLCSLTVKCLTAVYVVWNASIVVLHSSEDYWMLLSCTICFAVSLLADRLMPLYEPVYGRWFPEYGALLMIAGMGSMLFGYFARFYQFRLSFEEEKKQFARQASIQKAHYQELSGQMEDAARQRHDMRHHLRVVSSLLEEGNTEKALDYLSSYRIAESGQKSSPLCPNLIIDAMLQYYKTLASEQNILFDASVQVPPELPISDTSLAILFGNLLENALEACQRGGNAPGHILVNGKSRDGKLFLRFENTLAEPTRQKKGMFLSSKNGKYGLGTQSVRAVVKQLDGAVDFEEKDGCFCVSVVLPTANYTAS